MKLWIFADSNNGYTTTSKFTPLKEPMLPKMFWRMTLCGSAKVWLNRGTWCTLTTSTLVCVQLLRDLFASGTVSCGIIIPNRKGVPQQFKDTKFFAKGQRGQMRWERGQLVYLQWLDNKPVTFVSTMHRKANLKGAGIAQWLERRTRD